jgi:hypothetical protein
MSMTMTRSGYGLILCSLVVGGRTVTGAGLTEQEAERVARTRAAGDYCRECGVRVPPAEATLCRRVYGHPLCHHCREAVRGAHRP